MKYSRDRIYVGGEWARPDSTSTIDVVCPANGEVIGCAPDVNSKDVDVAVGAARRAYDSGTWSGRSLAQRAEILAASLKLLELQQADIASLVTAEMGVPLSISRLLVQDALNTGHYFLGVARELPLSEIRRATNLAAVVREPVGVVASIAPWNGPFAMAIAKIIPPLVAGCTVVFKPAPETPLDVFLIAEALERAGLPAGVFNLITGGREAGKQLVAHPGIDKVSFTGSTAAGRQIGKECGGSFKRMQLELGGKSAAIIAEDADIGTTMEGLAIGGFFNSGQVCAAFSRVLVPRSRYDEFVGALCATAESFVVGDPVDPQTTMGPLVSERQRARVESYIARGKAEGATLLTGGGRPDGLEKGWFVQPTVFGEVSNQMSIAREEIFGPVVVVIAYDTLDEAIALANDSDYGLHGAIFTASDETAYKVASRIHSGTVSVNKFMYNIEAPFGGVKCSGVGRDTGREAVEAYFELKTVNITPSMEGLY
jgi:aldehyde dehydrogenase (NAD+)